MRSGWIVYRGISAHTVAYMDRKGKTVHASGRAFFETEDEAKATARAFGWLGYGIAGPELDGERSHEDKA